MTGAYCGKCLRIVQPKNAAPTRCPECRKLLWELLARHETSQIEIEMMHATLRDIALRPKKSV